MFKKKKWPEEDQEKFYQYIVADFQENNDEKNGMVYRKRRLRYKKGLSRKERETEKRLAEIEKLLWCLVISTYLNEPRFLPFVINDDKKRYHWVRLLTTNSRKKNY